jgi:hypothetical protein
VTGIVAAKTHNATSIDLAWARSKPV